MRTAFRRLLEFTGLGPRPNFAPTPATVEANIRHLVIEIAWYGILIGTTVNFLQVYLVRLGATSLQVGALTYGPALVSIFWQLPAARLLNRSGHRMRWMVGSGIVHRLAYPVIALIPFLFTRGRTELTVLVMILQAFPISLSTIAFLSAMADAVPPHRLPQVMGWRMAAMGLASTLSTLIAGQVLQRLPFPISYQLLFLVGFVGSLGSSWHVMRLQIPDRSPEPLGKGLWRQEIGRMRQSPGFVRFLASVLLLQLSIGMMTPLLPLYWVRRLGATDGQISLVITLFSGIMVLGSLFMRRAVGRIGRKRTLAFGSMGYALYPLLVALSPSIWWLLPWAMLGGLFNAAISVTLFDNLVAVSPEEDRNNFIAVYNIMVNIALFAGPLLAGAMASGRDGQRGLIVAAAIGIIAGLMLIAQVNIRPRKKRPVAAA